MIELQSYAEKELEFTFGRKLSKQFSGPVIESETPNDIRFYWFMVNGCDTTKAFVKLPKRGIKEPEVSSIEILCK